jgi:excinuclease UvrABC nuclease subunit
MFLENSYFPNKSGIYLFRDKKGNLLYIGKAKNIKSRMQKYLNDWNCFNEFKKLKPKSNIMKLKVSEILKRNMLILKRFNEVASVEIFLIATTKESDLIAKHKPKYNRQFAGSSTNYCKEENIVNSEIDSIFGIDDTFIEGLI